MGYVNFEVSVGMVLKSEKSGFFVVESIKGCNDVTIKFLLTGHTKKATKTNIRALTVSDPYYPRVCGVGFIGEGKHKSGLKSKACKKYYTWRGMISRCYEWYKNKRNASYENCTVCSEWLNYQNFADWYEEKYPLDGKDYHLDKDTKVPGNKVYSPDYCAFIEAGEHLRTVKNKEMKLTSPEGEIVTFDNMTKFSSQYGLTRSCVGRLINGKLTQHKGWTRAQ